MENFGSHSRHGGPRMGTVEVVTVKVVGGGGPEGRDGTV